MSAADAFQRHSLSPRSRERRKDHPVPPVLVLHRLALARQERRNFCSLRLADLHRDLGEFTAGGLQKLIRELSDASIELDTVSYARHWTTHKRTGILIVSDRLRQLSPNLGRNVGRVRCDKIESFDAGIVANAVHKVGRENVGLVEVDIVARDEFFVVFRELDSFGADVDTVGYVESVLQEVGKQQWNAARTRTEV